MNNLQIQASKVIFEGWLVLSQIHYEDIEVYISSDRKIISFRVK